MSEANQMNSKLNTVKMIWAYMLEAGHRTTGKWDYYGGRYEWSNSKATYDEDLQLTDKTELLAKIKEIGINWDKMKEPKSSMESAFTDTFHESDEVETLLGTLHLKDGTEILIGVSNAERRFSDYAKHLVVLFDDEERIKRILGE